MSNIVILKFHKTKDPDLGFFFFYIRHMFLDEATSKEECVAMLSKIYLPAVPILLHFGEQSHCVMVMVIG